MVIDQYRLSMHPAALMRISGYEIFYCGEKYKKAADKDSSHPVGEKPSCQRPLMTTAVADLEQDLMRTVSRPARRCNILQAFWYVTWSRDYVRCNLSVGITVLKYSIITDCICFSAPGYIHQSYHATWFSIFVPLRPGICCVRRQESAC